VATATPRLYSGGIYVSRTTKTRPYWVQRYDRTLGSKITHDHRFSDCIVEDPVPNQANHYSGPWDIPCQWNLPWGYVKSTTIAGGGPPPWFKAHHGTRPSRHHARTQCQNITKRLNAIPLTAEDLEDASYDIALDSSNPRHNAAWLWF